MDLSLLRHRYARARAARAVGCELRDVATLGRFHSVAGQPQSFDSPTPPDTPLASARLGHSPAGETMVAACSAAAALPARPPLASGGAQAVTARVCSHLVHGGHSPARWEGGKPATRWARAIARACGLLEDACLLEPLLLMMARRGSGSATAADEHLWVASVVRHAALFAAGVLLPSLLRDVCSAHVPPSIGLPADAFAAVCCPAPVDGCVAVRDGHRSPAAVAISTPSPPASAATSCCCLPVADQSTHERRRLLAAVRPSLLAKSPYHSSASGAVAVAVLHLPVAATLSDWRALLGGDMHDDAGAAALLGRAPRLPHPSSAITALVTDLLIPAVISLASGSGSACCTAVVGTLVDAFSLTWLQCLRLKPVLLSVTTLPVAFATRDSGGGAASAEAPLAGAWSTVFPAPAGSGAISSAILPLSVKGLEQAAADILYVRAWLAQGAPAAEALPPSSPSASTGRLVPLSVADMATLLAADSTVSSGAAAAPAPLPPRRLLSAVVASHAANSPGLHAATTAVAVMLAQADAAAERTALAHARHAKHAVAPLAPGALARDELLRLRLAFDARPDAAKAPPPPAGAIDVDVSSPLLARRTRSRVDGDASAATGWPAMQLATHAHVDAGWAADWA